MSVPAYMAMSGWANDEVQENDKQTDKLQTAVSGPLRGPGAAEPNLLGHEMIYAGP